LLTRDTTQNWSGEAAITRVESNLTVNSFPEIINTTYPNFFSAKYSGILTPTSTGLHTFSLFGGGYIKLLIDGQEVVYIRKNDFSVVSSGWITLEADVPVSIEVWYSSAPTLSSTLGVSLGWVPPAVSQPRWAEAVANAEAADASIVFVSDAFSEGGDRPG
jgi:beta-glucosidase